MDSAKIDNIYRRHRKHWNGAAGIVAIVGALLFLFFAGCRHRPWTTRDRSPARPAPTRPMRRQEVP